MFLTAVEVPVTCIKTARRGMFIMWQHRDLPPSAGGGGRCLRNSSVDTVTEALAVFDTELTYQKMRMPAAHRLMGRISWPPIPICPVRRHLALSRRCQLWAVVGQVSNF